MERSQMYFCLKKKLKQILKSALFFSIYYSGTLHLLILMLTKFRKQHHASILFYHRFSNGTPDIYKLPHLDIREFKKQIHHIKKMYKIINMDDLSSILKNRKEFTTPSVVITIDDGYINNYTLAYPVLKKLRVPALIYLTTGLIGTKRGLWVDDLMDMLSVTNEKKLCFPELLGDEVLDICNRDQKRLAVSKLFKLLLYLDHERKIQAMNHLFQILFINDTISDNANRKMLNWQEVTEMSKNKIYFGAHTITHPTLNKMDFAAAKREIYESKKEIEKKLGKRVGHFAIPNGKNEDFSEELKEYCKNIELDTVVSTEPGLVSLQSDPYFLKRIIAPPPMHVFACQLAMYMFFKRVS